MKVHHQSTFELWPLEDKSVQAIITSPPYWGLRKYDIPDITIGDWQGQYGLETSVQEYVEHTLLWIKEAHRVLKNDGLLFLNLGDKYINNTLLKIPDRIAISLIEGGWLLRNNIVWHKPNSMPESVQNRFSTRFENIFMFAKQSKYYFDLDAVRVAFIHPDKTYKTDNSHYKNNLARSKMGGYSRKTYGDAQKGKNPGDVWNISTQKSAEKHYAMWPEKLVERMVLCSSRPADIVLDPFCGSGTTLMVADRLNREGIGIDLGYKDIQERRLSGIQKELLS